MVAVDHTVSWTSCLSYLPRKGDIAIGYHGRACAVMLILASVYIGHSQRTACISFS